MTKEIIGFINRNNDIFNIKEDESTSKYCCKAGQGHEDKIATFTEDGDVKDSNKTIDDFVTKIQPSADGNLASLDENGNLQDSGKNVNDFAPGDHTHTYINNTSENVYAEVITESANNGPHVDINLDNGDGEFARATIDLNNINNLGRALTNPNAPISGGDSLITNGQVFTALQTHTHNKVENIVENAQSAKLYADNQNQGEPAIIIELSDNNTPEGSVTKSANINIESIDNLNRALDKPDTAPDSGSDNLVTSGGVYTAIQEALANARPRNVVSTLPNLSEVSVGDEYLYTGQSAVGREYGQTYKCESKLYGDITLDGYTQDEQEISMWLNHAKTIQKVTGGTYIMTGYRYEPTTYIYLYVRIFPNSVGTNFQTLTDNVLAAFISAGGQGDLDIDQSSDQSATVGKVWTPKYKQELIPYYNV